MVDGGCLTVATGLHRSEFRGIGFETEGGFTFFIEPNVFVEDSE
jgi:hypothetical protein